MDVVRGAWCVLREGADREWSEVPWRLVGLVGHACSVTLGEGVKT